MTLVTIVAIKHLVGLHNCFEGPVEKNKKIINIKIIFSFAITKKLVTFIGF